MRKNTTIVVIVAFALFLGYMIYSMMDLAQVNCEVCMEYHGRTECRRADGTTAAEAQKTATDVACTLLASGMTDSIACQNTVPKSVMCKGR